MSFTEQDFRNMDQSARIRKVIYAVKEHLRNEKSKTYITSLVKWLNNYNDLEIEFTPDSEGCASLINRLLTLLHNLDPHAEADPCDDTNRTILPVTLLLDNLRSPHNVGSILRNADASGVNLVIATGLTPLPGENKKVDRTSMNAHVPVQYTSDAAAVIHSLKKKGYHIAALEKSADSIPLADAKLTFPLLLIAGCEESGIPTDLLEQSDTIVHIPMYGTKNSINVSVAIGIALYVISEKYLHYME